MFSILYYPHITNVILNNITKEDYMTQEQRKLIKLYREANNFREKLSAKLATTKENKVALLQGTVMDINRYLNEVNYVIELLIQKLSLLEVRDLLNTKFHEPATEFQNVGSKQFHLFDVQKLPRISFAAVDASALVAVGTIDNGYCDLFNQNNTEKAFAVVKGQITDVLEFLAQTEILLFSKFLAAKEQEEKLRNQFVK